MSQTITQSLYSLVDKTVNRLRYVNNIVNRLRNVTCCVTYSSVNIVRRVRCKEPANNVVVNIVHDVLCTMSELGGWGDSRTHQHLGLGRCSQDG